MVSELTLGARRRAKATGVAVGAGASFVVLGAWFWIGSNSRHGPPPGAAWTDVVGEIGSWRVLPSTVLVLAAALVLAARRAEARFLVSAVVVAGVLMYAARITLQALGADDDGGRLSDFPSGHASATAAVAGALTVIAWTAFANVTVRVAAVAAAAAAAVVMGWARVAGGGHTVLDVAGGVALGLFCVAVCALLVPPWESGSVKRTHALYGLFAVATIGFVLVAAFYDNDPLATVDQDVAARIARNVPSWAEALAGAPSWIGGWIGLTILGIAAVVYFVRERAWRELAFFLVAYLGSQLVAALLGEWFDRPAPHLGSAASVPSSVLFPSEHATAAAASLGAIAFLAAERVRSQRARAWLWAVVVVGGLAIGLSRIVLNVEYVSDVVAGWCLGLAWLSACLLVRDAVRSQHVEVGAFAGGEVDHRR